MTYNITIDDIIGNWGYSKQYIRQELAKCKNKPCSVLISSPGGDVGHALDIRQQFIDHGDVTVYMVGCVASAATIIATGAKKVNISKYCMFLVHKCSNFIDNFGAYNADQIQELIDELKVNKLENDKFDLVIANMYADKCKKKVSDILDILKSGQWMTAQEALDKGFVDEIIEGEPLKTDDVSYLNKKLNLAGLPAMPAVREEKTGNIETSLLQKILVKLDAIFNLNKKPEQNDVKDENSNLPTNTTTMNEKFVKINAILNVKGLAVDNDGKMTLTAEQMQAVNDRIEALETDSASKDNTIAERDATIAERDNQIAALQENPADETHDLNGDEKEDDGNSVLKRAQEMYDGIKNLI